MIGRCRPGIHPSREGRGPTCLWYRSEVLLEAVAVSTTHDLVAALKAELQTAGITYAAMAQQLGMAESSIKRVFAKPDMPLSRVDEVLRVLKMDFAELARKVADAQP